MSDALSAILKSDTLFTCLLMDLRLTIVCVSVCRSWASMLDYVSIITDVNFNGATSSFT